MGKRALIFLIAVLLIVSVSVILVSCSNTGISSQSQNNSYADNHANGVEKNSSSITEFKTHTVSVTAEEEFKHYFTFLHNPKFNRVLVGRQQTYPYNDIYGSKSSSILTVNSYLYGFVEYSGYVNFITKINDSASENLYSTRRIDLDYYGNGTSTIELESEKDNDATIDYRNIDYIFLNADITITYHDEGLSGYASLSYESIKLTSYNYNSYLAFSSRINYITTTIENGQTIIHQKPIAYYYQYSITKFQIASNSYEYRDVKITLDNGQIIYLNALGSASFNGEQYDKGGEEIDTYNDKLQEPLNIVKVEGYIDFYPPAIYEYI